MPGRQAVIRVGKQAIELAGCARNPRKRSRRAAMKPFMLVGCSRESICCNKYHEALRPVLYSHIPAILPFMSVLDDFRRLTRAQRHTFVAAFLGWTMDSLDFFLLVFCAKAIAAEFHTAPSAVFGAVFLTQAFRPVGAVVFGRLADRYGRRPVLMANILSFSVIELACGFAPSLGALLVLRGLFGLYAVHE